MKNKEEAILNAVREHNERGEGIYWKRLTEIFLGDISETEICNIVMQLEKDGKLIKVFVGNKGRMFKHLYLPPFLIRRKNYDMTVGIKTGDTVKNENTSNNEHMTELKDPVKIEDTTKIEGLTKIVLEIRIVCGDNVKIEPFLLK